VPISHVIFRSAYINDAQAIIEKAHRVGAHVVVDTYQSLGTVPVDVTALNVDFACGGVLKWLCGGPGVAYLYVRPDLGKKLEPKLTDGLPIRIPWPLNRTDRYTRSAVSLHDGTTHIPALEACRPGLKIIREAGVENIAKNQAPDRASDPTRRPARMAHQHPARSRKARRDRLIDMPDSQQVCRDLLARDILVDWRPKAGVRFSPHFYNTDRRDRAAITARGRNPERTAGRGFLTGSWQSVTSVSPAAAFLMPHANTHSYPQSAPAEATLKPCDHLPLTRSVARRVDASFHSRHSWWSLSLFFADFLCSARKRLLLNTPTSRIRSASLGLVEISGVATGPYTLPARSVACRASCTALPHGFRATKARLTSGRKSPKRRFTFRSSLTTVPDNYSSTLEAPNLTFIATSARPIATPSSRRAQRRRLVAFWLVMEQPKLQRFASKNAVSSRRTLCLCWDYGGKPWIDVRRFPLPVERNNLVLTSVVQRSYPPVRAWQFLSARRYDAAIEKSLRRLLRPVLPTLRLGRPPVFLMAV